MDFNELLISAVEKRKTLYDRSEPNYCNRNFINAQWRAIGSELDCDENEARKRWTQLRDYFQKNHRHQIQKNLNSQSQTSYKKKKWFLYDNMTFLIPHLREMGVPTSSGEKKENHNDLPEEGNQEEDNEDMDDSSSSHASSISLSHSQIEQLGLLTSRSDSQLSIKKEPWQMQIQETLTSSSRIEKSSKPNQSERIIVPNSGQQRMRKRLHDTHSLLSAQSDDEDELFFRSLIPKMKRLDMIKKMECQAEILMTVLKYIKSSTYSSCNSDCQLFKYRRTFPEVSGEKCLRVGASRLEYRCSTLERLYPRKTLESTWRPPETLWSLYSGRQIYSGVCLAAAKATLELESVWRRPD
ncbi:transcription factor adf-1 [Plakobranchus ocellatus]|uniref:Transcription factor adf-1 n=1 Tax=Plakobranchus ocellatus TaxID=259542 RepID=A0AAV4CL05_9GAST|nr:transcription factor adf-1 [Plakobranchus ocellatus]